MIKRIYLSGKMTGLPEFNYPAFNAEAARLRALGFDIENPAENPEQDTYDGYMRQALRQMLTCDTIAMLPGWINSNGAMMERDIAQKVGMTIVAAASIQCRCGEDCR
jgi:hypothetical protein